MTTVACLLDLLALVLLLASWPAVRGTTLVAPWCWLGLSLLILPLGITAGESGRLLAAALTLCPTVALLGAKRPQDKAWQFIVATFWLILVLPAVQAVALNREGALDLHPARSWFLASVVALGMLNSLFSRYWFCVLLAGAGQALLLAPYLPLSRGLANDWTLGLAVYSAAVVSAVIVGKVPRRHLPPWDRAWRDFRDAYGLVWALRVAERFNDTARANGWNIAVGWGGFHGWDETSGSTEQDSERQRACRQSLLNLLRRFVTPEWIARREARSTG
jgi:hypothetical protein